MITALRRKAALVGTATALTLALAACGGADDAAVDTADEAPASDEMTDEMTDDEMTDDEMTDDEMTDDEMMSDDEMSALTLQPVGEACSAIDPDGEGSSEGMADDPVATAASNNPLLTTLVAAVTEAQLGDTLNSGEALTVFAPYDPAFDAFTEEQLNGLLADTDALTDVLTLHVVGSNNTLEDLEAAGTVETLQGGELTLDFEAGVEDGLPTVSSGSATANVLCGDIQTANATVHLIDTVLMP